ncbi:hypothetical protein HYU93_00515 [Candidatus Daviesbacteria bacterium]|nr:hypothetical protein [Candidatus Daviesbacteria bacterium]
MDSKVKKLLFKTFLFILSLSSAWWLIKSGYLNSLVETVLPIRFASEILAGMFYTSFLTSPIALAMLIVLAEENNPILTALLAGFGAALGDFLIVRFFRAEISSDLKQVSKGFQLQKINTFLQKAHLGFLVPVLGAFIVASPIPDEIGLLMLGVSHLKYREIAILTYILNTAGILLIVIPVNLLS